MRERNEARKARCKKIVHDMDIVNSVRERFTISQLRLLFACMDRVTPYRMWSIYEAFEDGLTVDQVKLIANPVLDDTQASVTKEALLNGLNETYTKMISSGRIPYGSMERLSRELLYFQKVCNNTPHISNPVAILIDPDYDNGIYDYFLLLMHVKDINNEKEVWIYDKYSDSGFLPLETYKNNLQNESASKKYVDTVLNKIESVEKTYYNHIVKGGDE
jgi:hypothetical protein